MHALRPVFVIAAMLLGVAPALTAQQTVASSGTSVLDRANLDTTCAPCADFYQYANGGWLRRARIPAAYPMWGSFHESLDKTNEVLRQILEDSRRDSAARAGTNTQKLGAFYGTCLDSAGAESEGVAPLAPFFNRIAGLRTPDDVTRVIGELHGEGFGLLFYMVAGQDPKNSADVIVSIGQGGLGLPDRDYYSRADSASRRLRSEYVDHIARMLELSGVPAVRARRNADSILALESRLAEVSMTRVQRRDPDATYHKMSIAEAQALTPRFDWTRFMRQAGAPAAATVNVGQPDFFRGVNGLFASVPVDTWKAYLRWRVLKGAASALSLAFVNEDFRFNRNFTGATELLPRSRRCLDATNGALGELLGQEYAKRAFRPEAKERALELVNNLESALRERIRGLTWMSDSTKTQALAKLEALRTKIGYPDRWQDFSALEVQSGPFIGNLLRVRKWAIARNFEKIGKPVDHTEWLIPPQTVDAFALNNEIVFPAGILQPPFFDPQADDAVNFGAIGAVIGHEMTHHFDDGGRKFDAAGNLRDWWTVADAANYQERAQRVVDQFDAYTVVDSVTHVNGKLTLGENISDLGGLKIAYEALQTSLAGRSRTPIDGFTPEQRFFLSYAQVWRHLARPEYARARVATDPHAPWMWRVNGPLSNMPEFVRAFGCKEGDRMVRPASIRAQIW